MSEAQQHRKVYAKGFYDALRSVGITFEREELPMISEAKHSEMLKSMSTVAQRVYTAVPISESWSAADIHSELMRSGTYSKQGSMTTGCVNSLISAGLVLEPKRGFFIRAPIRPKKMLSDLVAGTVVVTDMKQQHQEIVEVKQMATVSPLTKLSQLSSRAKGIADAVRELADDIELTKMEIEDQLAAGDQEVQKLRQLKQLLNSLN